MILRPALPGDAAGIAALIQEMKELKSVAGSSVAEMAGKVRRNLQVVASSGCSRIFVAAAPDGRIAGYCAVHWVPLLFFSGGEAYVTELFVRPAESGHGIGSKLLDLVVTEARQRGCSRLSLLNGRDGESYLRKFYQKRGWTERERMANFILPLTPAPANSAAEN